MSRLLLFVFVGTTIAALALWTNHSQTGAFWFGAVALVALGLWITFIPTWVAYRREHPNRVPILLLNLFLGWTLLGWVAALVWACLAFEQPAPVRGFADRVEPTLL